MSRKISASYNLSTGSHDAKVGLPLCGVAVELFAGSGACAQGGNLGMYGACGVLTTTLSRDAVRGRSMSCFLYPSAKEKFLTGQLDLMSMLIRVVLIDPDFYAESRSHEYLSDIPFPGKIAYSEPLEGKSVKGGVFDADDAIFYNMPCEPGDTLVIYHDTGDDSTSDLIAYMDNLGLLSPPVVPASRRLVISWDDTGPRIFKI